jgi:hypothetical protein
MKARLGVCLYRFRCRLGRRYCSHELLLGGVPSGPLEQLQVVGGSAGTFSQGIKEVETNYVVWKLVVNCD